MDLLTSQAMKAGFYGGVVIDYPNSAKAKKFFLVLMTGGTGPLPQALGKNNIKILFYYTIELFGLGSQHISIKKFLIHLL